MKASELRVGNYVKFKGCDDKPFKVFRIDTTESSTFTTAEPIPLTEEWLLRFGFEQEYKSQMHSVYFLNGLSYYFWYKTNKQYAQFYSAQIEINYIHQLQNLYFALTGEELILTDKKEEDEDNR
jgi:hypothetical protein